MPAIQNAGSIDLINSMLMSVQTGDGVRVSVLVSVRRGHRQLAVGSLRRGGGTPAPCEVFRLQNIGIVRQDVKESLASNSGQERFIRLSKKLLRRAK